MAQFPDMREKLLSMAEQRRLQAVRGGSLPIAFQKTAPLVCDELLPLDLSQKRPWTFGIPLWELRSLIKDVLITWNQAQVRARHSSLSATWKKAVINARGEAA